MAYSLPHNMSLQQLTELQEAASAATSSRFSDRPMDLPPSATSSDQASLRHMLKKTRAAAAAASDHHLLDKSSVSDDDEAAAEDGENAEDEQEEENDDESKEYKAANSSLLSSVSNSTSTKHVGQQQQQLHEQESAPAAAAGGPTWLSEAMLRQAAAAAAAASQTPPNYSQWLSMPQPQQQQQQDLGDVESSRGHHGLEHQSSDQMNNNDQSSAGGVLNVKGFLELHASDTANSDLEEQQQQQQDQSQQAGIDSKMWNARFKADLVTHPLYEQLLSAHISCLRTATPVDQLPKIDAQLAHSSQVAAKYSMLAGSDPGFTKDKDEVNEFMAHYVTLLRSFKEQLQQHVRVHAMEAVVACWELEQSLFTLTGVSPGEGTGATMSEDEDEQADCDSGYYDTTGAMDGHDFTGFGPLIPTETERTLMERVRHELKIELKQGYKAKINDVREEILRKRRAGKLPGDTTSVLKSWWHAHSKWPYPSEDDKARLVQETGLELKQINNWFINQRKRNWHSNPSSSTSLKNKRKR